jgi:hypothetical protein
MADPTPEADNPLDDQPVLRCARLLACGRIEADLTDPDRGYTLHNVIVHVRPADRRGFPFRTPLVWLFAQLYGDPGEYTLRVRVVGIEPDEDGEAVEVGEPVEFGPWDIEMPGDGNYVECFGFPLEDVRFPAPGVFEFQLWADGVEGMLYNERVEARE